MDKGRNRKKLLAKSSWFKGAKKGKQPSPPTTTTNRSTQRPGSGVSSRQQPSPPTPTTDIQIPPMGRDKPTSSCKQPPTPTTVLFVEQTKGGELARRMRQAEEQLSRMTGWKVKIVEKSGKTLKQILVKSNPWATGMCERMDCYPCSAGDADSNCYKRNILYESTCIPCSKKAVSRVYVGESSRSSFERGNEHATAYKNNKSDSHMFKHATNEHPGEPKPKFQFKVVKTFQSSLMRQVSEAVRIRRRGDSILNSKGVYNRCSLPRLVVEQDTQGDGGHQDEHQDELQGVHQYDWSKTAWWRRKRSNEDDDSKPHKKPRLGIEGEEWGSKLSEDTKQREKFLAVGLGVEQRKTRFKQPKIRLQTEAEGISRMMMNEVMGRVGNQTELSNHDENISIWEEVMKVESGVHNLVNILLDSAMERVAVGCELNNQSCNSTGIAFGRDVTNLKSRLPQTCSTPNSTKLSEEIGQKKK